MQELNKSRKPFVEISENDGEYIVVMRVDEETDDVIKGRTVYTSSAYGSAVVNDVLEAGRPVTFMKSEVSSVNVLHDKNGTLAETLKKGLEYRNKILCDYKKREEQFIQRIEIGRTNENEIGFTFMSVLPNTEDEDGIPIATESYYYAREDTTPAMIQNALKGRNDYVSSSGKFLKNTKIVYMGNDIGILEAPKYNKVSNIDRAVVQRVLSTIKSYENVA